MSGLSKSHIPSLKQIYSGKVRDCYAVGEDKLLLVASDRISAFDVILGDPIPGKGKVLTALTNFWFEKLKDVIPNHLTGIAPESVVKPEEVDQVKGRAVVSKRLKPILIECVARGYIIGGGWKDYLATGKVCGVELPAGLKQAQKLPEPIFTPAAKAELALTTKTFLMNASLKCTARRSHQPSATPRSNSISVPPNTRSRAASSSPTRNSSSVLTMTATYS